MRKRISKKIIILSTLIYFQCIKSRCYRKGIQSNTISCPTLWINNNVFMLLCIWLALVLELIFLCACKVCLHCVSWSCLLALTLFLYKYFSIHSAAYNFVWQYEYMNAYTCKTHLINVGRLTYNGMLVNAIAITFNINLLNSSIEKLFQAALKTWSSCSLHFFKVNRRINNKQRTKVKYIYEKVSCFMSILIKLWPTKWNYTLFICSLFAKMLLEPKKN